MCTARIGQPIQIVENEMESTSRTRTFLSAKFFETNFQREKY